MKRKPLTIGVNSIQCGSIQAMTNTGVEQCFVLRADGQPNDAAVQLAIQQPNLSAFIKTIVETARHEFPEVMRDVPPL